MKLNNKKLTELRRKRGVTQTTMSKDLGIPRVNLSRYETGYIRKPSEPVVKAIANYLECNIEDLILTGEELVSPFPSRVDVHVYVHWGED
jgi:transcriptional regulator with XRE-family HTH domain